MKHQIENKEAVIWKVEAQGDTVYVAGVELQDAKRRLADVMGAEVLPFCAFTVVSELPDDEELL